METLFAIVFVNAICCVIGGTIAHNKGRSVFSAVLLCLLLGIWGIIIVAIQGTDHAALNQRMINDGIMKVCPWCYSLIDARAQFCPHCKGQQYAAPKQVAH